jgi:CubicO group peptidase (beta-lactamase class C family)
MITRQDIDTLAAETGFSGVVRIDRGGEVELEATYGLADRAHEVPNTLDTQFGVASATKGLTALAIVSLVVDGILELSMPARSFLGDDLPLIEDAVTIEHLLAHRSGIGDYVDEDEDLDPLAYLMPVPVHELTTTEDYLRVLDGHPAKFAPGERFSYCNSGYVVLALIAERAARVPFHELVERRVCEPAGMRDTAFLRSDELPGRAAIGYLAADGPRTNVFHLPVRGSGDGGVYTTAADVSALWRAFFDGQIVPRDWVTEMVRPRSATPDARRRYGLGFWLAAEGDAVSLTGADAGVSFRSVHDPARNLTHTMISNTTDAWQVSRWLAANA